MLLELFALLLSILLFAFVNVLLAYVTSLGFALAFGIDVNFYGMWMIFLSMAVFCLIFVRDDEIQ